MSIWRGDSAGWLHGPSRRDLLYAKASGFNTVRFSTGRRLSLRLICAMNWALLVPRRNMGAGCLKIRQNEGRYENSVREMIFAIAIIPAGHMGNIK